MSSVIGGSSNQVGCRNPNLTDESSVTTRKAARPLRRYRRARGRATLLISYTTSWDTTIADTIALDEARAVAAIRRMRERFKKPEMTPAELLLVMEAAGLIETVDVLRPHVESL
ncbi:hypothetical protein [Bradyrhizobium sp. DOA9]|uniref:hypothetical protein n=1 Tax=Bradyrhizobium sp. DOA9 TaxID=1126627 RepID=UPI001FCD3FC4|nr:hypothetical protein [Bradyrhizobium sp. DOA9]